MSEMWLTLFYEASHAVINPTLFYAHTPGIADDHFVQP